jgi:5'-3' exonuclease
LRVFREYGFNPVVVFDGAPPGSKDDTNARRDAKRAANKEKYDESVRKNAPDPKFLVDAFNIHGHARLLLIAAMQVNNFDLIQAPYEADTQLIQCWRENPHTSAIVTCDSDVLMFFNPGLKIINWGPQHPGVNFETPLQWAYNAP